MPVKFAVFVLQYVKLAQPNAKNTKRNIARNVHGPADVVPKNAEGWQPEIRKAF